MKLRPGTPEEAGMSPERVANIRRLAKSWVESGQTPALVVLAARRGIVVLHEAFGRRTAEPDSPALTIDTIFPIQSITKVITATAVMCLVEDGLIGLNRPVQEYIPEFAGEGKEAVMVHHLLTHTSGMSQEDVVAERERRTGTVELPPPESNQHPDIHAKLFLGYGAPIRIPPGQEVSYFSFGYALLGEILRRVTGRSLADVAAERIFRPLGMGDTYYIVPDSARERVVHRPPGSAGSEYDTRAFEETPDPAGGVYSTAIDMAIFCQMFLNGGIYGEARVLSRASVTEMTRNQVPGIPSQWFGRLFPEGSWGYGWSVHGDKRGDCGALYSPAAFEHWGSGFVYAWADPTYEVVGVYFSVLPLPEGDPGNRWNSDLFTDAVTAAIEET